MTFKSVRGTKDILPEESHLWQKVEEEIRRIMHLFNFREIRTPVFEETALFARSIGELSDIVGKEMYTFPDRSGTPLSLRPEMTASVIRAYIQHHLGQQQPLTKLYYLAPMFRQERPQAGRLRQFHQFGAETIGGQHPAIDAEIIALATEVYRALGIDTFELRINSVGCQVCRPAYKQHLQEFLRPKLAELSDESQRRFEINPLRILDSKDEPDRAATKDAPLIVDHLCEECRSHFTGLQQHLNNLAIPFTVDGRIVRGLDYYTKTAFEIVSPLLGSQDALAGGGRYDLLVRELGGKQTPAVGFAAGMERLLMVLQKRQKAIVEELRPQVFFVAADAVARTRVLQEALNLRREGISCEIDLLDRSVKAQMREADRQKAEYVVVVGEHELKTGEVVVKNMKSGDDVRTTLSTIAKFFRSRR